MQILHRDQILAWLPFQPRQARPASLPSYSWRGIGLVGNAELSSQVIDLNEGQPSDVFLMAYPKVGLAEAAQIYLAWRSLLSEFNSTDSNIESWRAFWSEICHRNGWRNDSVFVDLLTRLAQTPDAFQEWVNTKSLQAGDLLPLNSLDDVHSAHRLLVELAELQPSRSAGKQLLELGIELLLMGESLPDVVDNPETWLSLLRERRYPRTTRKDQSLQEHLSSLAVPKGVQLRGVRLGDRTGIEIRLTVHSGRDLQKKLEQVQELADRLTPESGTT